MSTYLCIHKVLCLSIYPSNYTVLYLSIYLRMHVSIALYLSIYDISEHIISREQQYDEPPYRGRN